MTDNNFCQLWLTCADKAEANRISKNLLNKHLIACARQISITSDFHWQDKIDHAKEVLLVMESRLDLFDQVEVEVAKVHTYDTFVLEATKVAKISAKAQKWLQKELQNAQK